jgi:hypothetical protein
MRFGRRCGRGKNRGGEGELREPTEPTALAAGLWMPTHQGPSEDTKTLGEFRYVG